MKNNIKGYNKFISESIDSPEEHERILGDYYNTGLGHISLKEDKFLYGLGRTYTISGFGDEKDVLIFSHDEIISLKEKLIIECFKKVSETKIDINIFDACMWPIGEDIIVKEVISESKFREYYSKILNEKFYDIIFNVISNYHDDVYSFGEIYKNYYIFE
jgi:hypothetical protein